MKDTLRRHADKQAQATLTPASVVSHSKVENPAQTPKAPTAARSWGAADPGHEYRPVAPAPAPKPKQFGPDPKMVARLADITSKR